MAKQTKPLTARQAKNKLEKVRSTRSSIAYADDVDVEEAFSFEEISVRELVRPELSLSDKTDLMWTLRNDKDLEKVKLETIPKFITYDTFQFYNTPIKSMKMAKIDDENKWQYDFLSKINNTYLRTVTEKSLPYSYIVTREYVKLLAQKIEEEQQKNPGKSGEDIIKDMMDMNQQSNDKGQKGEMDKMIEQANKEIEKKMQDFSEKCDMGVGKDDASSFEEMKEQFDLMRYLSHVRLGSKLISEFVKTSLKLSTTHFSSKCTQLEESILDSDEIEDLFDAEYILPIFRNLHLDDIQAPLRKYHLNFDIYIDVSGSMDSQIRLEGGNNISGLDLCKVTTMKLLNMGYGKDIYFFNDNVKLVDKDILLKSRTSGGTDIEKVIAHINKVNRPGLILTDMQDSIQTYSKNAYFIGMLGARFEGLQGEAKAFVTQHQIVKYENNTFIKV